jgi:hypothetical protein
MLRPFCFAGRAFFALEFAGQKGAFPPLRHEKTKLCRSKSLGNQGL